MVEAAWKLAIEAQDSQWEFAGAAVGALWVCQLPSGLSLKIDLQAPDAVSVYYCVMLLYQTYGYWLPPTIYIVKTED